MATAVSSSHAGCSLLSTPCCSSSSNDPVKSHPDYFSSSSAFSSLFTPYFYFGLNLPINQVTSAYSKSAMFSHPLPYAGHCVPAFRNVAGSIPQTSKASSSPQKTSVSFPLTSAAARRNASAVYYRSTHVGSSVSLPSVNTSQLPISLDAAPFFVLDPTRSSTDGLIPRCLTQPIPGQRYIDEHGNVYEYVVDDDADDSLSNKEAVITFKNEASINMLKSEEQIWCLPDLSKSSFKSFGKRRSDEVTEIIDAVESRNSFCDFSPSSNSVKRLCTEVSNSSEIENADVMQKVGSFFEENGSLSEAKSHKSKNKIIKRNGTKSHKNNSTNGSCSSIVDGDGKKRGNPGSGYPGVSWNSRMQAWLAFYMDVDGTRRSHTFKCAKCGGVEAARIQAVNWLSMKRMEIKAAQAHVLLEEMKRHSAS